MWRIRSNLKLQNAYKSPDVVTEMRTRKLEWLGHVTRMVEIRIPKITHNTKPEGRRGVGRPKLKWLGDVEAGINTPEVQRWRLRAQDRKERTVILREAKAKLKGALKPE
jgi:hypothetical protein